MGTNKSSEQYKETLALVSVKRDEREMKSNEECSTGIISSSVSFKEEKVFEDGERGAAKNDDKTDNHETYMIHGVDENAVLRNDVVGHECKLFAEESSSKTSVRIEQLDKVLSVVHSPARKFLHMHRPVGGESSENYAPVEESSKSSEQDACSCDNEVTTNDEIPDAVVGFRLYCIYAFIWCRRKKLHSTQ